MNIYLDENLSENVANALNFLNMGYFPHIHVFSTKNEFGKGVPDEEILPGIGKVNGILITRDYNIQRKRLQFELYRKLGIGIFFLKLPHNQNRHWELVKLLISKWEDIINTANNEKRPFAFLVQTRGALRRL